MRKCAKLGSTHYSLYEVVYEDKLREVTFGFEYTPSTTFFEFCDVVMQFAAEHFGVPVVLNVLSEEEK